MLYWIKYRSKLSKENTTDRPLDKAMINAQLVGNLLVTNPSAEITLPVLCIMTRGVAGSQVTLCGEWLSTSPLPLSYYISI